MTFWPDRFFKKPKARRVGEFKTALGFQAMADG